MNKLINKIIYEPWPWWVGGPLIGLFVLVLLLSEKKQLGISSSYQYICAKVSPWTLDYFKNPDKNKWQFFFIIGLVLGGAVVFYVVPTYSVAISSNTINDLSAIGVEPQAGFAPAELYNFSAGSVLVLGLGGIFLGFGARYANGCTAGHAIMGCAQLAPASIISTICFFIGGLAATYLIVPYIF